MNLAPEEHADVQCIIQRWVDSSISKTVNTPKSYTVRDVEKIYMRLYKDGAKGGTVYVDGSRDAQVLSLSIDDHEQAEKLDILNFDDNNIISSAQMPEKLVEIAKLRGMKQDRNIGNEIGDVCPICKEGTIVEAADCATCNNCCGL